MWTLPSRRGSRPSRARTFRISVSGLVRHFTDSPPGTSVWTRAPIPGSCTMKYNPKINDRQAGFAGFQRCSPSSSQELSQGLLRLMFELERMLAEDHRDGRRCRFSPQPEPKASSLECFSSMPLTKAGAGSRPRSLCRTQPTGQTLQRALCFERYRPLRGIERPGNSLGRKRRQSHGRRHCWTHDHQPNTLGSLKKPQGIVDLVHARGGLVYGDGANMNAVLGIMDVGCTGWTCFISISTKRFPPLTEGRPGSRSRLRQKNTWSLFCLCLAWWRKRARLFSPTTSRKASESCTPFTGMWVS